MERAVDIHAHYGNPELFPKQGREVECIRLPLEELEEEYGRLAITAACFSPIEGLYSSDEDMLLRANERTWELSERYGWFYQWAVVNPLMPASFRQAEELLKNRKCVGVKLHPDIHGYPLEDCGEELFAFCAGLGTVVECHSGDPMSPPEELARLANRYPAVTVIAAHLGYSVDGSLERQVQAAEAAAQGNLYIDVSSVRSIIPHLLEWAAERVTAEKILFGTDTPLHHIAMMKARVESARLEAGEIRKILWENAGRLFPGGFYSNH